MESQTQELTVVGPSAVESITRAEVDMQISTAHRFPRNMQKAKSDMLTLATLDEETAAACFYALPRGGKTLRGGSVRMAEIALSKWGNCRQQTRIVSIDSDSSVPHVVIESIVHDLESNVAVSMQKTGRIMGKKANGGKPDADDINLAVNRTSAIAFRDSVFKIVPGAVIKPVVDRCIQIAAGNADTLGTRRAKMVDAFSKLGVDLKMILNAFGYSKIDEVGIDDMATLQSHYSAIKNDEHTIEELFSPKTEPLPANAGSTVPSGATVPTSAPTPAPTEQPAAPRRGRPPKAASEPAPAAAPPVQEQAKATEPVASETQPEPTNEPPFEQETLPSETVQEAEVVSEYNEKDANLDPSSNRGKILLGIVKAGYTFKEFVEAIRSKKWDAQCASVNTATCFSELDETQMARLLPVFAKSVIPKCAELTGRPAKG